MKLGDMIKEFRTFNGLTIEEFSKLSGLSNAYISMLEKGRRPGTNKPIVPTYAVCLKIARALGLTMNEFVSMIDDMPIDVSKKNKEPVFSQEELDMIDKFRALDEDGQKAVLFILNHEYGKKDGEKK